MQQDASVSASGMRLVKLLVGRPPCGVAELAKETKISRTAVAARLGELMEAGFVERKLERSPGRGRPHNVYRATDAALLLLFANNQRLVMPMIWRAIYKLGNEDLTEKVLDLVAEDLVAHYEPMVTAEKPQERFEQILDILESEGAVAEMTEGDDGQILLHKRSCPFLVMADEHQTICGIELKVFSRVVGHPVRRVTCRHDGDPCCSFALAVDEPIQIEN